MSSQTTSWDDYRTAFTVARAGSLTAAARKLNCNHATVLRHINRLETALNIRLFIRHQRGYRLTDAGHIMLSEMPAIYQSFSRMENLMGSVEQDISGNLRITTLVSYSTVISPILVKFHNAYPQLRIQLITTDEIVPLERGIAHVSLRAGQKPSGPDLIAREIMPIDMAYFAADNYVKHKGLPATISEFNQHDWVMPSAAKQHIPYVKEFLQHIDVERIVFQSNHIPDISAAVAAGMGIGMMPVRDARKQPGMHRLDIRSLAHSNAGALWFVYHRDLRHNAKVQTLYGYLCDALTQEVEQASKAPQP